MGGAMGSIIVMPRHLTRRLVMRTAIPLLILTLVLSGALPSVAEGPQNVPFLAQGATGTPEELHEAAMNGDTEKIIMILDANPHFVNRRNKEGRTALTIAACMGYEEVAELLLTRGADVNTTDDKGRSPLLWAAGFNRVPVAALLLDWGAKVNARDRSGTTPLHWAAWGGFADMTKLLIEKRAEINPRDSAGRTPIFYAAQQGHREVEEILRAKGATL
jgi:ankyrin repeat protein